MLSRRLRNLNETLRCARRAVALAERRVFNRKTAVVVQCRAPKHGAVRHHASTDRVGFAGVTFRRAASLRRYPQVAGIKEADELETLARQQRTGAFRNAKLAIMHPRAGKARANVGLFFCCRRGIAAVTCRTSEA